MTSSTSWSPSIPSLSGELLQSLIGKRATRITRYSWLPKEDIPKEYGIPSEESFSHVAGSMAVTFESGETIGVTSDPGLNSVVTWLDRDTSGKSTNGAGMDEDFDAFPIEASDPQYSKREWKELLGDVLTGAVVLHLKTTSALKSELPGEVGLCLEWKSGGKLIASHGLHDGSDDFSVLSFGQISPQLREHLEERRLL